MFDARDPATLAGPIYIAALLWERRLATRRQAGGDTRIKGYEGRDTWASLAMGTVSVVTVGFVNLGVAALAQALWPYRAMDLGNGWLGWTAGMLGWDFAYYWAHRWQHEIRLFWAMHVNHHSSAHYNFATALRQPWLPLMFLIAFPPLALVGVRPSLILVCGGINLIYQFWIHTELVDKMPRWFELVFNTPSHHRVHHGSNAQYLDRNHGGILIVWDRLFGTFEPEGEPVVYGLTKNIHTFNPLRIFSHEVFAMFRDVAHARGWADRLGVVFRGPDWSPEDRAATRRM
jgi:sterol desaturase/sphingolipid hydroxylase (fatty acid hydroxylase superfamily)